MRNYKIKWNIQNFICCFLTLFFSFDFITSISNFFSEDLVKQQITLSSINFLFKLFYSFQPFIEAFVLSFVMIFVFQCKEKTLDYFTECEPNVIINKLSQIGLIYEKNGDNSFTVFFNSWSKFYFGEMRLVLHNGNWILLGSMPQIKKVIYKLSNK